MRLSSLSRRGVNLALGLVALGALLTGGSRYTASRFDERYPGFVESNLTLRHSLLARSKSLQRDMALAETENKLRWAAAYRRLGFDPDVFEELAFERELARRDRGGVR